MARCPLQGLAQDRYGSDKGGIARPARGHPAVGDCRGSAQRIRVTDTHPDRRTRFLHRLWRHRARPELKNASPVIDKLLGPQRLDELHSLAEAPHPALRRGLELLVMMIPA